MVNIKKSLMLLVLIAAIALALTLALSPAPSLARDGDGDGSDTKDSPPDCDDKDPNIYPEAPETCDGVDNNCDGTVDEGCGGGGEIDTDGDGFLDTTEQAGITLPTGLSLAYSDGTTATQIQPCDGSLPRERCVKWDSPDVFIIVDRTSPSNLALPPYNSTNNPDPLAILRGFTNSAGDPVVPHELTESRSTDRLIADGQHAIRVSEQNDSDLGPLGFAMSPDGVLFAVLPGAALATIDPMMAPTRGLKGPEKFQPAMNPTNCTTMINGPGVVSAKPRPSII